MKKVGFTLAEVIVTLGIIGLLAAVTAPLLGSLTPDQDKVKVLKAYKMLNDTISEIINDPSLYAPGNGTNTNTTNRYRKSIYCEGLNCTEQPTHQDYSSNPNYKGLNKFAYILASKLELEQDIIALPNHTNVYNFQTRDGIKWEIWSHENKENCNNLIYPTNNTKCVSYSINIDTNGDKKPNSRFPYTSKNADQFHFQVNGIGKITPASDCYLTKAYLANPNKLNDKKADYAKAKELYNASKSKS